jgi:hypothetical protein
MCPGPATKLMQVQSFKKYILCVHSGSTQVIQSVQPAVIMYRAKCFHSSQKEWAATIYKGLCVLMNEEETSTLKS